MCWTQKQKLVSSSSSMCACSHLTTGGENEEYKEYKIFQTPAFNFSLVRTFYHIDFICIKNASLEMKDLHLSHYFRSKLATELILKWHIHTNHISYVTNNRSKMNIPTLIIYLLSLAFLCFSETCTSRLPFPPIYSSFKFSQQFKRTCLPNR